MEVLHLILYHLVYVLLNMNMCLQSFMVSGQLKIIEEEQFSCWKKSVSQQLKMHMKRKCCVS